MIYLLLPILLILSTPIKPSEPALGSSMLLMSVSKLNKEWHNTYFERLRFFHDTPSGLLEQDHSAVVEREKLSDSKAFGHIIFFARRRNANPEVKKRSMKILSGPHLSLQETFSQKIVA